ncbi:hypothetical protein EON79_22330, partial [bacterium]
MTPQFRPPKQQGGGNNNNRGRGRGRGPNQGNRGLPQTTEVDLELLPEKDYSHFDGMTPTALAKEAKAAKIDFKTLTRGEVIERLLPIVNKEKDPIYV